MESESNTLINALIGAIVTVILSSFAGPFAPVFGGMAAGYLERTDGARVGAISGAIALVPLIPFMFFGLLFLGFVEPAAAILFLFAAVFALLVLSVMVVALSALGGYLGVYIRDELE